MSATFLTLMGVLHSLEGVSRVTAQALTHVIAQAFVAGLWQGLVLIAVVAVALRMLPRLSAAVRFGVWGLAFALVAALPLLHFEGSGGAVAGGSGALRLGAGWGVAIALVWAGLSLVRAGQLLVQAVRLRGVWRRAVPVSPGAHGEIFGLLREGRRAAELCISQDVDAPSVIGFFSPRLLVPEAMYGQLTETELRQIVLHEREHLRRGDDWMNLLQKVGLVLFPLNPALLWVDRRLGLERELACDAGVVTATAAPFDYAHCLTRLAEHRMVTRRIALALSAWSQHSESGRSELARRVHNLLRPVGTMSPMWARVSVGLLAVGLGGGAVEMARVPGLISFADAAPVEMAAATVVPAGRVAMGSGSARVVPVVYRPDAQARMGLLKADVPVASQQNQKKHVRRVAKAKAQQVQPDMRRVSANDFSRDHYQQARMVLTDAVVDGPDEIHGRRHAHESYMLQTDFSPSYAAVPFGNGWLIIQL